ncbi:FimV/HubP family polar landmark protein [Halomonas koreensis]|uniref:FimV/HubP family polar landmark protein n=1 Tax=Halomonas koreensis TaxID=245385 RepID=A0ABU1G3D2_9GAMM|nr:FimV/HubP family polar landmark protein [Halomonas koreensis]MDR5867012.1 FimV/HubP family polar landmark protein [Halomonas koreensis]
MKRTLTLSALLPLSLASPLALALGLGQAEVNSTLDAPLRARLPLTDTAGLEAGLLNVSLADAEAYRAAGLARTPLAASVQMDIRRRRGRLVLELTTERPVREPWMDLLLRFDWPGGRQLREVTLLLDPPDYAAMPTLVAGERAVAGAGAGVEPSPAGSSSRRAGLPAASRAPADPARVRSGDTLWAVAGRLRPDSGISMNQMMLALVQANPEVFPTGNINDMRAGFTLVVPSREAIASRPAARADELVQAMNRAWADRGGAAPAPVPLEGGAPTEAVAGAPEAAAEATGAPSAPDGVEDEAAASPRLRLLTEEQAAGGRVPGEEGDGAVDGGASTGESAGESAGEPEARVTLDPAVLAEVTGQGALDEDERLLRLERRWQESRETLSRVQAERDALEDEMGDLRAELEALRERVAALAAGGAGVDAEGAGGVVPPQASSGTEADAPATPWWGALYQGAVERPWMLGGAGIAALLALWALVRRRRSEDDETSAFPFGEVQVAVPGGERPRDGAASAAGEPAVPSVRAGMPQAEAINEADIFIAYGRFDQARELLEAGLAREPERDDLRLKLMRVQLERGDRVAAEAEAARLLEADDPAIRGEAERLMGRQAPPAAGQRAVFSAAGERPPRLFGEHGGAADDADPGPPHQEAPAAEAASGEAPSAPEPSVPPAPDAGRLEEGGAPAPEEPPMPQVSTRVKDDGSEIIDYRPPPLEPSAAPGQSGSDDAPGEAGGHGDRQAGDGWAVEEVAFPPLGGDNADSDDAASSAATLTEARHLIEVGEVREARRLLERFLEEAADPGAREEARDLLDRYQP